MAIPRVQVEQIYGVVNAVFSQMTGREDLQVTDTNSLVAMGKTIEQLGKNDIYLNSLARRIGLTIDDFKAYRNKFSLMARDNLEWGAIVQKIGVDMPEATQDLTYEIGKMDGQSVDQYIISNPKAHQKFYEKETPYSFYITMSTKLLRDAFLSAGAMGSFINMVFGKVRNKIEVVYEDLARLCIANYVGNLLPKQEAHLVTLYNSTSPETTVNPATALADANFMRWMIGFVNNLSDSMENMSVMYNEGGYQKFSTKADQRFYMLGDVIHRAETVVQYAAFNPQYVTKAPDIVVPYWQANKSVTQRADLGTISEISTTDRTGAEVVKTNLIGIMFDKDAMGTFREEEEVLTTPVNARARYYNTFWHERQMWFNDMDEQGVALYLD